MSSKFEIKRQDDKCTLSGVLPALAYPRGTPLMISAVDPDDSNRRTFVLADGRADGFMARDSRVAPIVTDEELLLGFGIERPYLAGDLGSIEQVEDCEEITCGDDFIKLTSTGAIAANTALETPLSFDNGKFYVAQSADFAQYALKGFENIPVDPAETDTLRIRVRQIPGYKVP